MPGVSVIALMISSPTFSQELTQGAKVQETGQRVDSIRDLEARLREVNSTLLEIRGEVARSREEVRDLRQELTKTREELIGLRRDFGQPRGHLERTATVVADHAAATGATSESPEATTDARLAKLEEEQQLLGTKVQDQYQSKVESASKYRVRLSGIALLNIFSNRGAVDNVDIPALARARRPLDSGGTFGGTIRQSLLGLEVFGPQVGGANSSADIQFDFSGGFPAAPDGVTWGLVRLRTARLRLDWPRTSIVAGQDAPFFSPLSPTSLASLANPAFSYSGNLWTWAPQVRVEHRTDLSDDSSLLIQAGILDSLSWEQSTSPIYRSPQAGERSRQPAYATRVAWTHSTRGGPLTVGAGSYYARQYWGFDRTVDAWAGTADWQLPLGQRYSLTGEFYRGRSLGGLGGAFNRGIILSGPLVDASTSIRGLNSTGGWTQLKFKPSEKLEFNGAFGEDYPSVSDLRLYSPGLNPLSVARNESAFVNSIYRARSNLLLSIEYRRIRTTDPNAIVRTANHVNLGAGVLF
jgi:hypothetical protein